MIFKQLMFIEHLACVRHYFNYFTENRDPPDTPVKRGTVKLHSVAETWRTGRSPARGHELEASVPAQKSAPTTKGQF